MKEFYKTSNLDLASFLLAQGVAFRGISVDSTGKGVFLFEDNEECEILATDFLNNATAAARELFLRKKELVEQLRKTLNNSNKNVKERR